MPVNIDPGFQSSLQEQQQEQNFNSFLALPEVILARKKKPQQPLLDFTKSKILTSEEYINACEQLLAKRQENEAAAKRRVAERAANKESRRREKISDLQVLTRGRLNEKPNVSRRSACRRRRGPEGVDEEGDSLRPTGATWIHQQAERPFLKFTAERAWRSTTSHRGSKAIHS